MYFAFYLNGNVAGRCDDTQNLEINRWSTVVISSGLIPETDSQCIKICTLLNLTSQNWINSRWIYRVTVDSRKICELENTTPLEIENLMVYVSDPWYPAADNSIVKNLKFSSETCKN